MKLNDQSERVSEKTIARQVAGVLSLAEAIKQDVILFLDRNKTDYPKWRRNEEINAPGVIRVSSIGGNARRRVGGSYPCRRCGQFSGCLCNL